MDALVYAEVIILVGLMAVLFAKMFRKQKVESTIPGAEVTDSVRGNLEEISAAGGMYNYLKTLHKKHGPITSFSLGQTFCVSIASPELLRETAHLFNRPNELYAVLEPLITQHSVQFANGPDGQRRHKAYSRCFSHQSLLKRFHILQKLSSSHCTKWARYGPEDQVPLMEEMFNCVIPGVLGVAFGGDFESSQVVETFRKAYDVTWSDLEARLDNKPRYAKIEENFERHKELMNRMLEEALEHCRKTDTESDTFVQVVQDVNSSQEVVHADMLTVCVGGFHTTALLMTWCLYYLARDQKVQEKLYLEIMSVAGQEQIDCEAIDKMKYLRQVVDETLRCSVLAPSASRVQDKDMVLGGHLVKAGTPIIQSMGVMFADEKLFPNPSKFDPERFSEESRKSMPKCGFEPFGFAGKRKCSGYRLTYIEASLFISDLVRKFKVKLVEGQEVEPVYGMVTKPKEEIWVTVEKRT